MKSSQLNRRKFLRTASLSTLGAGIASTAAFASGQASDINEKPLIREYRRFGKTGFRVSDFGSGAPSNEAILRALLDSGVNLIDTGEAYANGNSERVVGRVIKDFDRSKLFINTKLYTEKEFPSKKEVIERTNQALERLQTDYVDCMQIHSAENSKILKDEAFHAGMDQLKKEGKVRHVGVSCHGNNWAIDTEESLDKILLTAVEDGRFDVILLAYNFANRDIAEKVLDACEQKDIATIIMKSNPVHLFDIFVARRDRMIAEGKEVDMYTQGYYDKYKKMYDAAQSFFGSYGIKDEKQFRDAASRFVLSNKKAHTTIWDFQNFDEVERMIGLSGQSLTSRDKFVLEGYEKHLGHTTCRIGCNDCQAACPHNIPVNKILRYNYYFSVKKQERRAMEKYARLEMPDPVKACLDCEGYCEKACRYGVWTRPLLTAARQNLGLIV